MSLFIDDLEDQCRRIARTLRKHSPERTPATFIAREIAVTLDHIESVRQRQREVGRWFVDKELYLDAEIMNLKERPSIKGNWLEQLRLRHELNRMRDNAEWHAQRLAVDHESALQRLQTRLMELLNRHDQLSFGNGISRASEKD